MSCFCSACCCILSKFYIKPQLTLDFNLFTSRCILSKFYIKPQPRTGERNLRNVVSYRNSTSNHNHQADPELGKDVVSYRNSTSNHNRTSCLPGVGSVVSYRNSTSNHNSDDVREDCVELYLIEILHQTTTTSVLSSSSLRLYLIEILHQTTTSGLILIDKVLLTGCLPL